MSKDIYEAINTIRTKVGYVQKDRNPKLVYSYVSESGLIKALRSAMIEEGVVSFVSNLSDVRDERYPNKETSMKNVSLTLVVTLYHISSGTKIEVHSRGEGFDSGDKSTGKATTNATKYALMKTFLLESGDDEAEASSDFGAEKDRELVLAKVFAEWERLKSDEQKKALAKNVFKKYNDKGDPNLIEKTSDLVLVYNLLSLI